MILKIRLDNFYSIKDEIILNFRAVIDTKYILLY